MTGPLMSEFPPPTIEPRPVPTEPGIRERWGRTARWKRWGAYGVATVVAVGAIGAVGGSPGEPGSLRTSDAAASTTAPSVASTEPPPSSAPTVTDDVETKSPSTTVTTTVAPSTTGSPPSTTGSPPTTTLPTTPAPLPSPGSIPALVVLALIPIERETPDGYNRELFGYGTPVDSFGCRTRALVLIRDSINPPQVDRGGCAVVAGDWFSSYDGLVWSDPGEVQVDHVVALKEAWDSGASRWDASRLEAFANDVDEPRALRVVSGTVNEAKGAADPVNWLPPDEAAVCEYLADWVSIKARWGLTMDESEHGRVRNLLTDRCPGQLVAPWVEMPPAAPTVPVAPVPAPPPAPSPVPNPTPADGNCDPSYPTVCIPPAPPDLDCGDITFRRFQVLPPDPHNFDGRDNDGLGCES